MPGSPRAIEKMILEQFKLEPKLFNNRISYYQDKIYYLEDEFWTAKQKQSSSLHKIPHPKKLVRNVTLEEKSNLKKSDEQSLFLQKQSHHTPQIKNNSIESIVTSPLF